MFIYKVNTEEEYSCTKNLLFATEKEAFDYFDNDRRPTSFEQISIADIEIITKDVFYMQEFKRSMIAIPGWCKDFSPVQVEIDFYPYFYLVLGTPHGDSELLYTGLYRYQSEESLYLVNSRTYEDQGETKYLYDLLMKIIDLRGGIEHSIDVHTQYLWATRLNV